MRVHLPPDPTDPPADLGTDLGTGTACRRGPVPAGLAQVWEQGRTEGCKRRRRMHAAMRCVRGRALVPDDGHPQRGQGHAVGMVQHDR